MNNKLFITLEGLRIEEQGVPVDALVIALQGLQDALRLMVEHLAGYERKPGRSPNWIRDQSTLRLAATWTNSPVAELTLDPAEDTGTSQNYGKQALEALQCWEGVGDPSLPEAVVERLLGILGKLPNGYRLWLGDAEAPKRVEVATTAPGMAPPESPVDEDALVYGWLKVVNWDRRTAELHREDDSYVPLRFAAELDDEMGRLGNQYVAVRGAGRINRNDRWQWIEVEQITATRSGSQPFDMEVFLSNPNPRIFDPDSIVRASEPVDVDEFMRVVREGRDA